MGFVADVNAGGLGMHDVQAEIFCLDFSCELPSLLPIHLLPTTLDRSPGAFSRLLLSMAFHGTPRLVEFNVARPGWRNLHNLSLGVRPFPFARFRPPPSSQSPRQEPCIVVGQKRSKVLSALAAEPCCDQMLTLRESRAIGASGGVSGSRNQPEGMARCFVGI